MGGVIMAFWDNFERKATDATANVVSKVKGVSDITRLNSMVSEEENRIREIYFKIGQTYVALHGRDNEAGFADLLNALKASQLKIEQCKQEIMDIKGVQKCERCGAEVAAGAAFCMTCGAQIPKIQPKPAVNAGRRCKKCGATVAPNARFCTSCGTPYVEETPVNPTPQPQMNQTVTETRQPQVNQNTVPFGTSQPPVNPVPEVTHQSPINPVPNVTPQPQFNPVSDTTAKSQSPSLDAIVQPQMNPNPVVKEQPQVNVLKKVCTNCGAELQDGVAFCIQCGMPVKKEEPAKENVMFENVNPVEQTEEKTSQKVSLEKTASVHSEHTAQTQQEELEKQWENPAKNVCPNCGTTLADNVRFCINCGEEIRKADEDVEEATMRVNPITFKKPDEVQTSKRPRFCIGCGAKLDDDSVFCTVCGKRAE